MSLLRLGYGIPTPPSWWLLHFENTCSGGSLQPVVSDTTDSHRKDLRPFAKIQVRERGSGSSSLSLTGKMGIIIVLVPAKVLSDIAYINGPELNVQ